jgi:hypothetical protein
MSEEKLGIKETKEVLVALNKVSLLVVKLAKDGIQLADGVELGEQLLMNAELKAALSDAFNNISAVPSEIKDLDAGEIASLVGEEIAMVPQVIEALKA